MSLIQCNGLTKQYGDKLALDNVSFKIESGQPVALVGPNGAGKTTLFNLLCGFISPTLGDLKILGDCVSSTKNLGKLSALPQDSLLDPAIEIRKQFIFIGQLQGLSKHQAQIEAERVLEMVDLTDVIREKPTALSHGMGKRVSIAQSLIGNPQIVLLDEPTAGIDPANAKKIRSIIQEQQNNTNFIVSSHNLDELEKLCDRVLYLEHGKLKQSLTLTEESHETSYISLSLQNVDMGELISKLNSLSGINRVEAISNNELGIHCSDNNNYQYEIEIMQLLAENDWKYKSIARGKTLEDRLFS
ncbi:ABC transporter ATP-binding protein [Shewanella sp. 202IG2-18]|uniref:ABC transporter ATP-binding protein n=1 Tax=Parashewanella hymeniacidonis TaxID=2807618 RepID=UPI0019604328|nr:ABC transporter ATP-binding protein [Parashewanella hymeniacidonis]MBM7073671.1 ABC transporter ATP-binding protein [Parashewanella hymeniacidonis]